jgi:YVTN family beta-propeller protein
MECFLKLAPAFPSLRWRAPELTLVIFQSLPLKGEYQPVRTRTGETNMRLLATKPALMLLTLLCSVVLCGCSSAKQAANTPTPTPTPAPATASVATGTDPNAVAVNPVTNKIYVANQGSNNVTVIDGATNNTTTVAVGTGPGTGPSAMAVNPTTNQIYVANTASNNVTVATP